VVDRDSMGKPTELGRAPPDDESQQFPTREGDVRSPSVPSITQPWMTAVGRGEDRSSLVAALSFVDGVAAGWGEAELVAWIERHLVEPKRMAQPVAVTDAVVGTILLRNDPHSSRGGARLTRAEELPNLLEMARSRTVQTLRAFIATPSDDRFLQAAIFAERVRRETHGKQGTWIAQPKPADLLSNIVLSLFAADILNHREFYEAKLCVCELCGRVSFTPDTTTRNGCHEHVPRAETHSGFRPKG